MKRFHLLRKHVAETHQVRQSNMAAASVAYLFMP
jgi:hypothetical protein